MKQHIHNHGKKYFTVFLALYCVLLIVHIATIPFIGIQSYGIFLAGIILAIFSHKRHGHETLVLLLIHMSLEWWQHAHRIFEYTTQELILSVIHAVFDGVFLWEELQTHTKKLQRNIISIAVVLVIGGMFMAAHFFGSSYEVMKDGSLFELFIMGGIMSCIVSHFFNRFSKTDITASGPTPPGTGV